ncbi:hypothetical protein ENSA7_81510 [Enhygromyxa salina]|uniref:Uncharacterized protein n=1 Tax=Enhygromyxa salina TaxID=215803 RepID=A0A2S9XKG0_9BACT|nr:hypothetical protein ENSA7_81510 [Enhygromyxa salina]
MTGTRTQGSSGPGTPQPCFFSVWAGRWIQLSSWIIAFENGSKPIASSWAKDLAAPPDPGTACGRGPSSCATTM